MLLLSLSLYVAVVSGLLPDTWTPVGVDLNATTAPNLGQESTVLNDIVNDAEEKRVEQESHEHQMDNDSAKSSLPVDNLTSNYSNESSLETVGGNLSVPTLETINKISADAPEEIQTTRNPEQPGSKECLIDENCEKGFYCLYEPQHSECVPCKQANATCSKDVECCEGQLCVFGQCTINATKGEAGTSCQRQNDCNTDLCCAFHKADQIEHPMSAISSHHFLLVPLSINGNHGCHGCDNESQDADPYLTFPPSRTPKALLFPVCDSRLKEGERCQIPANQPSPQMSWITDADGPKEHCPCAVNLKCQHRKRGAVCLPESSSEEDLEEAMYSEIDYFV